MTQIQYEDQSTVSFFYDLNSNKTRMNDNAPQAGDYAEYSYDSWNRLTGETRHISQSSYTVSYQYDVANRLTTLTYPEGMEIVYSYDDLGRTTEIKRYVDGSNDELLMSNIQYTVESLLTHVDYGNGLKAFFSYDSEDRISTIDVRNGEISYLDLDFTFDNSSNITQIVNGWRDTDSDWHSQTESYNYDGVDRLTSASCNSWSHTYSYDRAGNRTAKDSVTYTINTVNEITALSDGTSFTYDSNGCRTQKTKGTDTWVYTYDYANRLTKVEKNSAVLGEYVYDGGGKRIRGTEDSVTTTYVYSGLGVVYEENTTGIATYIYGPTGRVAKRTTINGETTTFYYHTDQLGSTRLVTDDNKNIVSAATYHPFGESHSEEGDENYLFAGKEKDSTSLYYFGARYYDCETGTFITRDPVTGTALKPQSFNQYAYCQNNPLKYVDLWGLYKYKELDMDKNELKPNEKQKSGRILLDQKGWDPNQWFPYEGVLLAPMTPVFVVGNVGVCVAASLTQNSDPQSQRVYNNNGYGLMIFIFDDEGNVVEFIFIPFTDLEDPAKMKEHYSTIKTLLDKYGISLRDFHNALEELELYCENIARLLNKLRYAGAGAILLIPILPPLVMMAGGGLSALATGGSFGSDIWGSWANIIGQMQNLITQDFADLALQGSGGGFRQ